MACWSQWYVFLSLVISVHFVVVRVGRKRVRVLHVARVTRDAVVVQGQSVAQLHGYRRRVVVPRHGVAVHFLPWHAVLHLKITVNEILRWVDFLVITSLLFSSVHTGRARRMMCKRRFHPLICVLCERSLRANPNGAPDFCSVELRQNVKIRRCQNW